MAITSLTQTPHPPHPGRAFPPLPARQSSQKREFITSVPRISTQDPSRVSRLRDFPAPDSEHHPDVKARREGPARARLRLKACRLSPLEGMSLRGCGWRGAEQLSRWEALIDLKQGRHGGKTEDSGNRVNCGLTGE